MRKRLNIDLSVLSLYFALMAIGWYAIYVVSYNSAQEINGFSDFLLNTPAGKQTIWIGISFSLMLVILLMDWKIWQTYAYLFYGLSLVLLALVLFLGKEIKGATAWFYFGGFTLQPSELAKFATNLALAAYLATYRVNMKKWSSQWYAFAIVGAPVALIMLQPDAGSALTFTAFLVPMYREGLPSSYYIFFFSAFALLILGILYEPVLILIIMLTGANLLYMLRFRERRQLWFLLWLALAALSVWQAFWQEQLQISLLLSGIPFVLLTFYWFFKARSNLSTLMPMSLLMAFLFAWGVHYGFTKVLKPHQQDRINVWLNPEKCDPQGSLYNLLQSKMAIASGGFAGKGALGGSMTRGNFVPEQATDFIFSTIGEEQGFIGSLLVIGLFLALILRLTVLAERQRSVFARAFTYGVAGLLFVHFFVNISMTMGLMPVIGIPLPFISKGGSALLGFTLLIAVALKLNEFRYLD